MTSKTSKAKPTQPLSASEFVTVMIALDIVRGVVNSNTFMQYGWSYLPDDSAYLLSHFETEPELLTGLQLLLAKLELFANEGEGSEALAPLLQEYWL